MNRPFSLRSLWLRARPYVTVLDTPMLWALALLCLVSLVNMYSAASDFPGRFGGHARNLLLAGLVMWAVANVPPAAMQRLAVPTYLLGLLLLVAVALFGDVSKGARRWLGLGFMRIQPSEVMKIAMPLMLAWFFHQREGLARGLDFVVAALVLVLPTLLIARQPDLGTAILVLAAGAYVIFLAGLHWRVIAALAITTVASAPLLWMVMKDYQRQRILTLIDPSSDPLGKGFHIIQSTIAVGSGGLWGKGYMQGTQAHLEFIPERTTDFIFAVFSEEFGWVGALVLLALYGTLIVRGFIIAGRASGTFHRLLAGSVALSLFTYVFVNMGMVTGILPVVGVPLPFMSYGGTAMVTLGIGMGILMSVNRRRTLVQH
jgi:rod shape determining protein RodA